MTPGDLAGLADDLAATVLAVPGVVRLNGGALGEIGTYLPGRRVAGIRLADPDRTGPTEVHVVLRADAPLREVAEAVHLAAAARLTAAGAPADVRVHVDDLA
ncbi:hypothetical protein [Kineococcus radiotolerans]|uniref:Asp23/Gls24 family envelope stress response protein n=1 Tax=Kineococcus radiotolerans (strain ATCC BAA-149 / DSM 14245 / SRS30216) TaxID=266940 RepID=A6WGJ1_KINRD|nr:hypothetical protein [Kineococcus radiotolerans]ABS05930.1 conserved hypothetical protein [Kineococcus radiotolerans SRS30216 = ATCC BAA-149]